MNILLLLSLFFVSVSCQYYGYIPHAQIGHNGAPLETPEVQAAKAHHFAAHAQARHPIHYNHHQALPLDTPEVASAKQQHFQDFATAARRNGVYVPQHYHAGLQTAYPVDTPEVQQAKAAHFAAHAQARGHYRRKRQVFGYNHQGYVPVISHNGVPLDTPEVEAEKAKHFAAHSEAMSRIVKAQHPAQYFDHYSHASQNQPQVFSGYSQGNLYQSNPWTHSHNSYNGAPIDTPEVQQAKAEHFAAHAKARGFY